MLHQPFTPRVAVALSLMLPLFLASCGNAGSSKGTTAAADTGRVSGPAAPVDNTPVKGDFYKRYQGTLAGKAVVAHLVRYQNTVSGYYQYTDIGQAIALNSFRDTVAGDDRFFISEQSAGASAGGQDASWDVRFRGNRLEGTWRSGDGGRSYDLSLTEANAPGNVPLSVFYVQDSVLLVPGKPQGPRAVATAQCLQASGPDAFFVNSQIARLTGGRAGDDLRAGIRMGQQVFFADYKKANQESADDPDMGYALNWTQDEALNVVGNDSGMLVLEYQSANYTGGAHGSAGNFYANIDLRERRTWALKDVITDTSRLSPLLDAPARTYIGNTDKKQSLEAAGYFVRKVPASENFYITPGGITFVYGQYEIASYAMGIIPLFVPYKNLMPC